MSRLDTHVLVTEQHLTKAVHDQITPLYIAEPDVLKIRLYEYNNNTDGDQSTHKFGFCDLDIFSFISLGKLG